MIPEDRIINCMDDNIRSLRQKYPNGLHFVVGDTHGAFEPLKALMLKIEFDPMSDHVYFIGDYNGGGNPTALLKYLSTAYQPNLQIPGFHLIRGNHERELAPLYPLKNLPDLFVLRGKQMTYFLSHAGMSSAAFELINRDMENNPRQMRFAYSLTDLCAQSDTPMRQLICSMNGLYSQTSCQHLWPSEEKLKENCACIIHGHTPYCYMLNESSFSYGDRNLFWQNQHICFSENLQSFDIDSNVKGTNINGECYRGLSCLCLEVCEEIAAQNGKHLTLDGIRNAPNCAFAVTYREEGSKQIEGDLSIILEARPEMKIITLDDCGSPYICS